MGGKQKPQHNQSPLIGLASSFLGGGKPNQGSHGSSGQGGGLGGMAGQLVGSLFSDGKPNQQQQQQQSSQQSGGYGGSSSSGQHGGGGLMGFLGGHHGAVSSNTPNSSRIQTHRVTESEPELRLHFHWKQLKQLLRPSTASILPPPRPAFHFAKLTYATTATTTDAMGNSSNL